MDSTGFTGKVVMVTGAGDGLGSAIARRFAAGGARVALIGRTLTKLQRTAVTVAGDGGSARPFVGDVTDEVGIRATTEEIVATWGRLDVLVNCAARVTRGTIEEIELDAYRQMMAVTLDGVIHTSRAALPHLRATSGNIVNVGSVSSLRGDWGQAAYNAAKGAVFNLTNCMALDHGADVRVNAVHPGATIVNDEMETAFAPGSPIADAWNERIPMGRVGRPDEVADVVAFLAGTEARYVNGAHIPVDGGLTASNGQPCLSTVMAKAHG